MQSIYFLFLSKIVQISEVFCPYHAIFAPYLSESSPFLPFQGFFDVISPKEVQTYENFPAPSWQVDPKVVVCPFRDA